MWKPTVLGLLLFVLLSLPVRAEPPAGYPFVNYDEGLTQAKQDGRPVFVYVGRFGCGWCEEVNSKTFTDPQLRALYVRRYHLVYVDSEGGQRLTLPSGERITEHELGARLKVFATPVFVYLEPSGREIFRMPGIQTINDFILYDRFVSEGRYQKESIHDFLAREQHH
jgi:thioredoxin-related protein